jgi:hypothetical protein
MQGTAVYTSYGLELAFTWLLDVASSKTSDFGFSVRSGEYDITSPIALDNQYKFCIYLDTCEFNVIYGAKAVDPPTLSSGRKRR